MRPSIRRTTGTLAVLTTALAGAVALADPAAAAVTRHDGDVRYNWATNCDSVLLGYPYVEASMGLVSSLLYDDAAPPRVGDVFYVVVEGAAIGDPYPCVGQKMRPDVLLDPGVQLAVSAANPIRCYRWDYSGDTPVSSPETALCPTTAQPPQSGGSASFGTAAGQSWDMPMGTGYEIQVPVVATAAGTVGAHFAVRVLDGNTNPLIDVFSDYVGVTAAATAPTPTPTPIPTPQPTPIPTPAPAAAASAKVSVPDLVKLDETHGKVPVRAAAGPVGSSARLVVRVRQDGRWVTIGRAVSTVDATTPSTVKVPVVKKWREALDGKRVKAKLVARVTAPSGDTATTSDAFTLRG